MQQTKDQQRKTVIDALDAALVDIDDSKLQGSRMTIELAFNRAWRHWSHASECPSVDSNDFYVYA